MASENTYPLKTVYEDEDWRIEKISGHDGFKVTYKYPNPQPSFLFASDMINGKIVLSCRYLNGLHLTKIEIIGEV